MPVHVALELTHRCTLRCRHCYLQGGEVPVESELRLEEWVEILAALREMGTLFLLLTGGEVFARRDTLEVLRACRTQGFVFTILTNGILVDEGVAREVAETAPLQVHVSILGDGQTHDAITQVRGSHARAVSGMRALRAAGVRVVGKVILTRESLHCLETMLAVARDEADGHILSFDLVPSVDGRDSVEALRPRVADIPALPPVKRGQALCADREDGGPSLCAAGRAHFAIAPDGAVMPCVTYRRVIGSVRQSSLPEIWWSPAMQEVAGLSAEDLTECQMCPEWGRCAYCPARGWLRYGDPTRPPADLCARTRFLRCVAERAE